MKATSIVGTNAHLSLLPDPSHPVLSFTAVVIDGLTLTHLSFALSATGPVTGSGVAIKTSVFQDLLTGLGSFTNKADLLTLILGGTVPKLVMKNVTLQVDRYISMKSNTLVGFRLEQN